ncbi:HD phosphohydrolase-like protein [Caballeronia arationis]|jgi:phosphonate degradation associated HDIG domain protein|uniref:Phosphonate degradation operons associated HDIG domain protein n=1 Tax=Caballeronia arationis TaxID=1777142 RepID=A0A7Z7I6R6_9BURK|nr:phosphonate degradation HD-domain oxygenase [Caballeronia arationis]SAK54567.1 HD phosphohydrolase-like protein [Caballeronia arationis]SOE61558.1 phosphonate degradation operons associated HDIG domain protein [Caballeronia arationis]
MALSIADIRHLFDTYGGLAYSGEPVTQLQHALQTATLAQDSGARAELVTASLLHDLGHLLNRQGETPTERGIDDLHQYYALPFLRPLFADAVLEPIRLHVDAKRCLCAIDPTYRAKLSADSVRSLRLQGGVFSEHEAQSFLSQPYAEDALSLRRWDDLAKDASRSTPTLAHFLAIAESVTKPGEAMLSPGSASAGTSSHSP